MEFKKNFKKQLFHLDDDSFKKAALSLFHYQAKHNKIYRKYLHYLNFKVDKVQELEEIPFLPIQLFKSHRVQTGEFPVEKVFESSRSTGQSPSLHLVSDLSFYLQVCQEIFTQEYGSLEEYHFLALLPAYLERSNSSLVEMAHSFIQKSQSPHSGFYLYNQAELIAKISELQKKSDRQVILMGVSFALLDLAESYSHRFPDLIIMETGGMKGRRKELTREELHREIKSAFGVSQIHSEYGMTELLSQAYSKGEGVFTCPPWMRVYLREVRDPFNISDKLHYGLLNIIDLANVDSCAFIGTQDLGTKGSRKDFSVLGRLDQSETRGCNLLYTEV